MLQAFIKYTIRDYLDGDESAKKFVGTSLFQEIAESVYPWLTRVRKKGLPTFDAPSILKTYGIRKRKILHDYQYEE